MKRKVFLICLLFPSLECRAPPDIASKHGASIYFRSPAVTWTKGEVDEQEDWFIERLSVNPKYPQKTILGALSRVEALVHMDPIECGTLSPTGLCNGLQSGPRLEVRAFSCVFQSAYTHEVFHWLQQQSYGDPDLYHTETSAWAVADSSPRTCQ